MQEQIDKSMNTIRYDLVQDRAEGENPAIPHLFWGG